MSKSPDQKASDSCSGSDKELSECPTCGDTFDTKGGMRIHHANMHGESLRPTLECEFCGDNFTCKPSHKENRRFCSVDCKNEFASENKVGKNNPLYKERIQITCEECGDEFKIKPHRKGRARFCSSTCRGKTSGRHGRKREIVECHYCGEEKEVKQYRTDRSDKLFCGVECHDKWAKEAGKEHHSWKGGHHQTYGAEWKRKRAEALERDNHTCQDCGVDEILEVHHITPARRFNDVSEAHKLSNLVTLCRDCHNKWEGLYIRPDPR